jgi:hypothetical protein
MSSAKRKAEKKKRRTAHVVCRGGKTFWTTQAQFWQWVRDGVVVKTGDKPLEGTFVREAEELNVILGNTVLNLARPNHLREAMRARRTGLAAK